MLFCPVMLIRVQSCWWNSFISKHRNLWRYISKQRTLKNNNFARTCSQQFSGNSTETYQFIFCGWKINVIRSLAKGARNGVARAGGVPLVVGERKPTPASPACARAADFSAIRGSRHFFSYAVCIRMFECIPGRKERSFAKACIPNTILSEENRNGDKKKLFFW